jgi:hypothetical protein
VPLKSPIVAGLVIQARTAARACRIVGMARIREKGTDS